MITPVERTLSCEGGKTARRWRPAAPLLLAVLLAAATAARADWIVTRDGGKVETKGGWQTRGKLVVFTLPNGTLSSLRADQVDVEASRRATEQAKKAAAGGGAAAEAQAETQPAKPKKAVWVLTDKDFRKPAAAGAPGESKEGKEGDKSKSEAAKETVPAPAGALQVAGWDRVQPAAGAPAPPGVRLAGTVRNAGADLLTEVAVTAAFYDESGALIGRVAAAVAPQRLGPGEAAQFTVEAPNVTSFAAVKFETQGRGFKVQTPAPKSAPATPPAPGGESAPAAPAGAPPG